MPHRLDFDERKRRVVIRYEGLVTANEYFHVIDELAEFDDRGSGLDGISIFLGAEVEIDPSQVNEVLERLAERRKFRGRNWAFVIEEPRQVAIGLLYQMAARGLHEVQVFATVEAAVAWLDEHREKRR